MSANLCYANIIGLSRSDCQCYGTPPADYNISLSGRYIDELQPLDRIKGLENCENGDIWNILEKERENAIFTFVSDIKRKLLKEYRRTNEDYIGGIGKIKYTGDKTISDAYAGARLMMNNIKHGVFKLNSIGTLFNFTGTIDLQIWNNKNEHIGIYTLNTIANKHTQNTIGIELPMWDDYVTYLEYFFIYDNPAPNKPKNNDVNCNCGGSLGYCYNTSNPCFLSNRTGWQKWAQISGLELDTLDFIDIDCEVMCESYGLTFDVEFVCDYGKLLCDESIDFDYNPLASTIADAIWYKAGEHVLRNFIGSTDLNRVAMMNGEAIEKFMIDYHNKYEAIMDELVMRIDITQSDCLSCKDNYGMTKRTLLT
jgi:hypothetical protein